MNKNLNVKAANSVVGRNAFYAGVRNLQLLGVDFIARSPAGELFTNNPRFKELVESATQEPEPKPAPEQTTTPAPSLADIQKAKPRRKKTQRNFRQTGYRQKLAQMKEGDVIEIVTAPFRPGEMQKAVCAVAHRMWGKGSYQTAVNGKVLEVMRCN